MRPFEMLARLPMLQSLVDKALREPLEYEVIDTGGDDYVPDPEWVVEAMKVLQTDEQRIAVIRQVQALTWRAALEQATAAAEACGTERVVAVLRAIVRDRRNLT